MSHQEKIGNKRINRKEFLQYLAVTAVAVSAVSPLAYFLGSTKKGAVDVDNDMTYGGMTYGGKRR